MPKSLSTFGIRVKLADIGLVAYLGLKKSSQIHWLFCVGMIIVAGVPESGAAGVPESGVAGVPESGVAGVPESGVAGMPKSAEKLGGGSSGEPNTELFIVHECLSDVW